VSGREGNLWEVFVPKKDEAPGGGKELNNIE
jgi:hypothetical protein